ncbi:Microtubule-associated protein RP/EB family member 1B [Tritrichomonas foetus]|uniref:Microtubule-associated protein RP/EB family member 1B n=1 Tax=Tritrichomonas foetus TaxID=1144522 RepID=A0A1J4KE05_9EUKA|nr:Microtubule-associated protein RP/EB family member 1B [Tritrichomonas foetus]|eukprot:OHT07693.1 Microtubule-associated protein RP/EB family member 1B [Tritrichomonas foetus]
MASRRRNAKMSASDQFIGRTELLDWINDTLKLNYTKVEDCANGAAFCQIVDMVHPSTVPLGRLNFNAILPHESMENLKILQEVFTKNGMTAIVDVGSLSKGRYVAALNVLQFLYQYVKSHPIPKGYDPVARRRQYHLQEPGKPKNKTPSLRAVPVLDKSLKKSSFKKLNASIESNASNASSISAASNASLINQLEKLEGNSAQDKAVIEELRNKIMNLQKINRKLKEDYDMMTQERDFYYEKLRKVEEFCQDNEEDVAYVKIFDILYETDKARGFVPPDEAEMNMLEYGADEDDELKEMPDDFEAEAELPEILKPKE